MAIEIQDTFTEPGGALLTAHSPDVGTGPWVNETGAGTLAITTATNRVRSNTGSNSLYTVGPTPSSADCDVSLTIVVVTALGGATIGVIGRQRTVTNAQNFYMARYNGANTWQLYRCIDSVFTQLGSNFTQAIGAADILTLRMVGDQISLLLNAVSVVGPVTDATFTNAGRAGLRINGGSETTGYHGDLFEVDVTAAPPSSGGGHLNRLLMGVG